jgi:acetoacetyl-CoA synthetase
VSLRHVPHDIVETVAIPMTFAGRKLEVPIRRLLQGVAADRPLNRATMANPGVLDWYVEFATPFHTRHERRAMP